MIERWVVCVIEFEVNDVLPLGGPRHGSHGTGAREHVLLNGGKAPEDVNESARSG